MGLLKKSHFLPKLHRGSPGCHWQPSVSPRYKRTKEETFVGRAILPADFFNSPTVSRQDAKSAKKEKRRAFVPGALGVLAREILLRANVSKARQMIL